MPSAGAVCTSFGKDWSHSGGGEEPECADTIRVKNMRTRRRWQQQREREGESSERQSCPAVRGALCAVLAQADGAAPSGSCEHLRSTSSTAGSCWQQQTPHAQHTAQRAAVRPTLPRCTFRLRVYLPVPHPSAHTRQCCCTPPCGCQAAAGWGGRPGRRFNTHCTFFQPWPRVPGFAPTPHSMGRLSVSPPHLNLGPSLWSPASQPSRAPPQAH